MHLLALKKYSKKKSRLPRHLVIIAIPLLVIFIFSAVAIAPNGKNVDKSTENASNTSIKFNKQQHSIDDSVSIWAIVNKGRSLPSDYRPIDLITPNVPLRIGKSSSEMMMRAEAAHALENMFANASRDGVSLMVASAYRSYSSQVGLYSGYVKRDGQANADLFSARPGHSEHQTGLAADVEPASRKCEIEQCFESTPEGVWVANNAFKHGFIIRYQKGQKDLTGYDYEPWHLRYIGTALATEIHKKNLTLEQFFNLPAFSTYSTNMFLLKTGS